MPAASAEVVKLAWPPLRVAVPSVVPPSANVTVPVGVPEPLVEATVAVKVTACPTLLGLTEEASAVVVVVVAAAVQVAVTLAAAMVCLSVVSALLPVTVYDRVAEVRV